MKSSNPVLGKAFNQPSNMQVDQLEQSYNAPAASSIRTGRMTIEDVVAKTGFLFAILVVVGALAWSANLGQGALLIGFLGAFGIAMAISFSKSIKPGLVVAYAGLEGLALGTLSHFYESLYPGIVSQAVIGTIAAFAGVLFMYRSGRVRATPQFTRAVMGAAIGYFILGFVSIIASFFGVGKGYGFYGVSGLGLLLAVAGVALASFFLVLDFDQIEKGVAAGVPEKESWRASFGLMVTIVWLYLEVLRLLSILRNDR
ncbi:MAG: Bax inhibitor-1/YccA family protein [Actinomycetes bacterium]